VTVGTGRARLAASILDSDLSNLAHVVRRLQKAGADRVHLDVMDGHFVPNISFGPAVVKSLRPRTEMPFDAHLMISEPSRYVDRFLAAGCDSITIHVEIEEPIEPTLRAIRKAGRAAGLAVNPATPLEALEPYRSLLDIILIMTVVPGFGGQSFMKEAAAKILPARGYLAHKVLGGEIHVDGGINRETAEYVGGLGVDVLVVGSALFAPGHDMGREIRLVKVLADEGYAFQLNDGKPPIPRDEFRSVASLPKHIGTRIRTEIELAGIPVVMLRSGGRHNPDGIRDYDLLVPRTVEALTAERYAALLAEAAAEADAWRATFPPEARALATRLDASGGRRDPYTGEPSAPGEPGEPDDRSPDLRPTSGRTTPGGRTPPGRRSR
jgi:ribulose-phosphate 3-epimerase